MPGYAHSGSRSVLEEDVVEAMVSAVVLVLGPALFHGLLVLGGMALYYQLRPSVLVEEANARSLILSYLSCMAVVEVSQLLALVVVVVVRYPVWHMHLTKRMLLGFRWVVRLRKCPFFLVVVQMSLGL